MRQICLHLLETYRKRGEILSQARHLGVLPELVRNGHVSNDEAYACIALYQNWSLFLQAEQWNHGLYRRCPRKPIDALVLIDTWVAAGSPRPLPIRDYAENSGKFLMAIVSAFAQTATDFSYASVVDLVC
jgi:hypothetical protein